VARERFFGVVNKLKNDFFAKCVAPKLRKYQIFVLANLAKLEAQQVTIM